MEAWAASQTKTDPSRMLAIGGDGGECKALKEQARQLGILPSVCFLGRVTGATKTWLLQNARCGCMPSRDWEAFPLVVMEAFAAGKPMIGTRILGLKDLITHGETGWLVAPNHQPNWPQLSTKCGSMMDRCSSMLPTRAARL